MDKTNEARELTADRPLIFGLTLQEVADGFSVSTKHIQRMVQDGEFPKPLKIGSLNRWEPDKVRLWTAQRSAAANGVVQESNGPHGSEADATVPATQDCNPAGSGSVARPKAKRAKRAKSTKKSTPPHPPLKC